ncbi:hypothetical protein LX15_003010 [Streptoalloteichus tenebrarius]|uniref:Uncharacterized protein n=1 Tax=Streptoalloteichus tenebrarius (strain ATCC 17920 / DSM 40477 / JCM 4838 / CBS 697.72 / NBRC 16177 / NCIMB 11028 / NRRL B-12390 / A12253. 1 / ISP 5477) TaxID=1933 RepID=A0ABT1HUV7_STRSD|nr:hypothetical protein [Streptoalloteichus tenebrarius]MCP2259309.1 hypothetical protein [Streptoalloteichus tenebrarius]BFE99072.1 hypothetical protein GCM10020241_07480 [Streptoalloteichus tenebrarius]
MAFEVETRAIRATAANVAPSRQELTGTRSEVAAHTPPATAFGELPSSERAADVHRRNLAEIGARLDTAARDLDEILRRLDEAAAQYEATDRATSEEINRAR